VEFRGTAADLGNFVRCRAISADRSGVVAERLDPLRAETVLTADRAMDLQSEAESETRSAALDTDCGPGMLACDVSGLPLVSLGTAGFTGAREWRG